MSRIMRQVYAIVVIAAFAMTLLLVGSPRVQSTSKANDPPLQRVNNAGDIRVTQGTGSQDECSVFIGPADPHSPTDFVLLNANNSFDVNGSGLGVSAWISTDGGASWMGDPAGVGGNSKADPATAINADGRLFVGYVGADHKQHVAYTDPPYSATPSWTVHLVGGGGALKKADKNHLWIDNAERRLTPRPGTTDDFTNPYYGRIYSAWTDFDVDALGGDESNPVIKVSWAQSDGSVVFEAPEDVSTIYPTGAYAWHHGVNIKTGPNGEVYLTWALYNGNPANGSNEVAMAFARSFDGGETWQTGTITSYWSGGLPSDRIPLRVHGHRNVPLGGGKTMRHASYPTMAVNQQSGMVYVAWTNLGFPPDGNPNEDPDIYMVSCPNADDPDIGPEDLDWQARSSVSVGGGDADQWFPWLSCDPITGKLACVFYDSRNFAGNDKAETFLAISTHDGVDWTADLISDVSWDGDHWLAEDYAGDYIGVAARGNTVHALWADKRPGNQDSMQVYTSPVDPLEGPVAEFYADQTAGCGSLTVHFTDQSTGAIDTWYWDFGDGVTSTAPEPDHTYTDPGIYTVTLKVTGAIGSRPEPSPTAYWVERKIDYVTVTETVADFSADVTSGYMPLTVNFTDESTGNPTSWLWDFGDGNTSTAQNPAHTYEAFGPYTVSLTVIGCDGEAHGKTSPAGYIVVDNLIADSQLFHIFPGGSGPYQGEHVLACPLGDVGSGDHGLLAVFSFVDLPERFGDAISADRIRIIDPLQSGLTFHQSMHPAADATQQATPPSPPYQTAVIIDHFGGCSAFAGYAVLGVELDGVYVGSIDTLFVHSPDNNGDGIVDGTDASAFGTNLFCDDLDGDFDIDAIDQALFNLHIGHLAPLDIAIDGPSEVESNRTGNFAAVAYGGVKPYSYNWYKARTCGATTWNPVGIGPSVSIIALASYCLKLVVSDGHQQETTYHSVYVPYTGPKPKLDPTSEQVLPVEYALKPNYPNPFNPATQVAFDLPEASRVTLAVYDAAGRFVAELVNRQMPAGTHSVPFNAEGLASGVYFYRLRAGSFQAVRKMVLLK